MSRKSGDDIRAVIGPKEPKTYTVSKERLRQITLLLRLKKAFSDSFCQRLRIVTEHYVRCGTSHELIHKGQLIALLQLWFDRSRAVRTKIWKKQTGTSVKYQPRTTLAEIQKLYFRRETKLYEPLQGHRRHLMANAALGLDVALKLCNYVLHELRADRRGSHSRNLWGVWVAMIIAEFRAAGWNPIIKLKPKLMVAPRFYQLIRELEATLPDPILKRNYAPVVFRQRFKRAAMLARHEVPETLAQLMTLWGNYDRVQRTTNGRLNRLLKRARRLYPLRPQ